MRPECSNAGANSESDDIRLQSGVYSVAVLLYFAPTDTATTTVSGGWDATCSAQSPNNQSSILDGGGNQQVIEFNAAGAAAVLQVQNLTVRHVYSSEYGGCISVNTAGSIILTNVLVQQCLAGSGGYGAGGGVYVRSGSIAVDDSTFDTNSSGDGAAIGIDLSMRGDLTVTNSLFTGNVGLMSAGGIGTSGISFRNVGNGVNYHSATVTGTTFENGTGHAVQLFADTVTVNNSVFRNNTDPNSGADWECGSFSGTSETSPPTVGQLPMPTAVSPPS